MTNVNILLYIGLRKKGELAYYFVNKL